MNTTPHQSGTVAALRDTLSPRGLNEELRVAGLDSGLEFAR